MRLSLSKARKHLKQTGLNATAETKFRTVIKGANNFQLATGKLSIPTLDPGEYDLEVFSIVEGEEPEPLTRLSFEILESDVSGNEPEAETSLSQNILDPKDKIIDFLEKQIKSMESNFQDRLTRELDANDARWKARLDQKDFELKLERQNQERLDEEREKISSRIERSLRNESKYKTKPDSMDSIMKIFEKVIPFLLPGGSGDSALIEKALEKSREMLAAELAV